MITTVTLNPMLDKTVYVDSILKGRIQRASRVESAVGGKGVNVSRQLKMLGCNTRATGFLGGEIGTMLERLLSLEGIQHDFVRIAGVTREGITYREADGSVTAVFEPPHGVSRDDAGRLVEHCRRLIDQSTWVVFSGSSPCAEADDVYSDLVSYARDNNVHTVVDSYGKAFREAMEAVPTFVKLNKDEYEQTFGKKLERESDYRPALEVFVTRGINYCVITDGNRPLYAASEEGEWKLVPPEVTTINSTGSGDSMIAGLIYGLGKGWGFERCLTFGAAAGAANAQKWQVANSSLEEITVLESKVLLHEF